MSSECRRPTPEELLDRLAELETAPARRHRAYRTSTLPLLKRTANPATRQQISEKLYAEVCSAWRMLTDVRFKLLGLLPLASLAGGYGLFTLGGGPGRAIWLFRIAIGLFGLVVTVGLMMYERRNDALCDDLISRGRRIEEEWGIDTGLFRGRRSSRFVSHGMATWTIYSATLALWIAVLGIALQQSELFGQMPVWQTPGG